MAQTQMLSHMKFRIANLQSNLSEKQKIIDEYKHIESQADSKIKGMQKIHSQKVKSLLNSIQILKKQKASIQGLSKQHKRSKLIQQLNKQINDQDLVIQILRKHVYQQQGGKQKGRTVCDDIIVKALKKGPERIRPLTRQQLRMEIDNLKQINLNLQKKLKQGDKKQLNGGQTRAQFNDSISQISSVHQDQSRIITNSTQQLLNRIRTLQLQSQNIKLQSNSKNKIIQKLKSSVLQGQKYKSQVQLLKNQIQIVNRKLFAYENIVKSNKQTTNKKLVDLYQRELKVEELEMVGKENSDKLKNMNETHSLLLRELQAEKEEIQAKYEELKQENQKIIFENISNKKHQAGQKAKIDQIRQINQRQKSQLSDKLQQYENQVQRILQQNDKIKKAYHDIESKLFTQREQWIKTKQQLIEQLQELRLNKVQNQKVNNLMVEIDRLKQQNSKLQSIFSTGGGSASGLQDDKLLLERLQNYKRKVEYLENVVNKGQKSKQIQIYNQLFDKYNKLNQQFMEYKKNAHLIGMKDSKYHKKQRKDIVNLTRQEKQKYQAFSSGLDQLCLQDVDSQILDNFNTSYDYSIHIDEDGKQTKVPKISQADKQLLKLINSDLWYFVKDDLLSKKLQQVSLNNIQIQDEQQRNQYISQQMRKIRNLSHPQGHKIKIYQDDLQKLQNMSDNISITSALNKQMNNYDSDVNIEIEKFDVKKVNQLKNVSSELSSNQEVSKCQSGESNIRKKKKPIEKATKLKFGTKGDLDSSDVNSQLTQDLLNSDVSSINISQRQLNRIDSDVETDFRKKKRR